MHSRFTESVGCSKTYPNLVDIEYRRRSKIPNAPLDSEFHDDLFLRPLGLKDIIAPLVRSLLSKSEEEIEAEDMTYAEALMPLKNVNWDIRQLPFRDLLLINESKEDDPHILLLRAVRLRDIKIELKLLQILPTS